MALGRLSLQKFGGAFLRRDFDAPRYGSAAQPHRDHRGCHAQFVRKGADCPRMALKDFVEASRVELRRASFSGNFS